MSSSNWRLFTSGIATLLLTAVLASPLLAQTNNAATPDKSAQPSATTNAASRPIRPVRRYPTLDDHIQALAKALDLTQQQQLAVKNILLQRYLETSQIRRNTSISESDRIAQLRALQDKTVQRIRAVLNDEQKKKYDPLANRQMVPAPDQKTLDDWLRPKTP